MSELLIWKEWFVSEGWSVVLACLTLMLLCLHAVKLRQMNKRVDALEFKYSGVMERAINAHTVASNAMRRTTGEFAAVEPQLTPEERVADTKVKMQ